MIIVVAHYNTYRKSPYNNTWQDTLFKCLKRFPNTKKIVVDWGSTDGSNIPLEEICYREKCDYKNIKINEKNFSWFDYVYKWKKTVLDKIKEENILYVEADSYLCGNEDQLLKAEDILKNNDEVGLVKMIRLCNHGIHPHYVDKQVDNGFILHNFEYGKKIIDFRIDETNLLSPSRNIRICWHNWDIKCTVFRTSYLANSIEELNRSKSHRKDKKRGYFNLGSFFCNKYRSAIGDYIFSYNYGVPKLDYSKSMSICDKYHNEKIMKICENSIIYYRK